VFVALILGGLGVARSLSMFGNNWVFQRPERFAVVAAALAPAFIASALFLVAARLLYSPAQIVLALYVPFYWAVGSSSLHLLPVLPGFTAGLFTKPLDNSLAFVAASCTCTVLLLVSLCTIRDRMRHGRFIAPVIALVTSVLASYAAYAFMQA
jgi:hypothetical protein